MTYEQLVEKVARAIWDVRGFVHSSEERMFEPLAYGEEGEYAPAQAMCQEAARAALAAVYEAMREPGDDTMEWIDLAVNGYSSGTVDTWLGALAASPLNPVAK